MKSLLNAVFVASFLLTPLAQAATSRSAIQKREVAPSEERDRQYFGLHSGLSLAHRSLSLPQGFQTNEDSRMRLRMAVGGYYEFRFIPYFGLRAEVGFVQRGYSIGQANNNNNNGNPFGGGNNNAGPTADVSTNFIDIPILAKAQIPVGPAAPYILFGPTLGFLVGKSATQNTPGQNSQNINVDNAFNSVNFGLNFGLGSTFEIVRHFHLEIGARYSLGLTNMLNNNQNGNQNFNPNTQNPTMRLNSLQFLGGVALSI